MATFKQAIEEYGKAQKPKDDILKKEQIEKRIYKPSTEVEEIRPIPISATETDSYAEAWFHTVTVNGYTQKVYCPHHNDGQECPLCEKSKALLESQSTNKDLISSMELLKQDFEQTKIQLDNLLNLLKNT